MKAYRKPGCKVKVRSQFHPATDFTPEKVNSVVDSILDRLRGGLDTVVTKREFPITRKPLAI
jgi:hypothetical protein